MSLDPKYRNGNEQRCHEQITHSLSLVEIGRICAAEDYRFDKFDEYEFEYERAIYGQSDATITETKLAYLPATKKEVRGVVRAYLTDHGFPHVMDDLDDQVVHVQARRVAALFTDWLPSLRGTWAGDVEPGDPVAFVPPHANSGQHSDVEYGVLSSRDSDLGVHVQYRERNQPQLTKLRDLAPLDKILSPPVRLEHL